jgi:hypothetical protein
MTDETTPQDGAAMPPASTGSTAHTPGPWTVATIDDSFAVATSPASVNEKMHCVCVTAGNRCSLTLANARLIAAAPELLAALKRQQANIRRWLETGVPANAEESRSISEQIDAAIKVADGER